jgi:hypothetical protein
MADKKISALTGATTPLAGTEVLPIVQSGSTVKVAVSDLTAGRTQTSNGIVQGTAATGYNFTANTPASGMTSQLLNWYEEGTWTPALTFATPGDLSVTYGTQVGTYTRIGNKVFLNFSVITSSFTYTTASSGLRISSLPFTSKNLSGDEACGSIAFSGITQVGYTQFTTRLASNTAYMSFLASGSGVAIASVTTSNAASGSALQIRGSIAYDV